MQSSGGFLLSPRVRVLWGDINLSSYNGNEKFPKNTPVVYDVQVDLQSEGEGPTAEMKWDPTGPGYDLYEWFISKPSYMKTQIIIEFFYSGGKKISFAFVWSGQSINYGNDMTVTVKMTSELSGLINANLRSTAQAYDEKTGEAALTVYEKAQKQFGLEGFDKLVQFNSSSLEYTKKAKLISAYGSDWTFGNNIANIAKQTGDMAFASNIGQASVIIMPPFSYSKKGSTPEKVLNGATDLPANQSPDPTKRYGYLLGPSLIDSVTRSYNWKPPQQDNTKNPSSQPLARDARTANSTLQTPPTAPQVATARAAARSTSSPIGVSNNRSSLGIQNKDNPEAPARQNALNDEKASELSLDTLMVPVLVGLKPHDILYIPSFTGEYIEDWIVQSVGYSQDNGRVSINVRATRWLGSGQPMNEEAAKSFKTFAQSQGLVGPNATLEAWDRYAWSLPGSTP